MNGYLSFLCAMTTAVFLGGCARGQKPAANTVEPLDDTLPQTVQQLTAALAENDTDRFSQLFMYPIARPYPLKDIHDAAEMKKYYSRLVDDSLRKVIVGPNSHEWRQFGWRGWSLDDGQYVWIDSLVYEVPYISKAENAELMRLRNAEMASLPADMRQGWEPVITLQAPETGEIFRIDRQVVPSASSSQTSVGLAPKYRLCAYVSVADLSGLPSDILEGTMSTEGTMQTHTYTFSKPDGTEIVYEQDSADGDDQTLVIRRKGVELAEQTVVPVYWLDLNGK